MNQLFFSRITQRAQEIQSLLCVGLDPRLKLPPDSEMSDVVQSIVELNKRVIDTTAELTLCYKPNIAFYEAYGVQGLEALEITLGLIPSEVPIILDAKRGDIGPTGEAYAKGAFEALGVDAITLSPYMGRDSIEPFLQYQDKGFFVLCHTSNPGNKDFQEIPGPDGLPLYIRVADKAVAWDSQRIGLVVGATDVDAMGLVRQRHPDVWFLAPGIGAQGGELDAAVASGINAQGTGIIPVVARGICQAEDPGQKAREYRDAINRAREQALESMSKPKGQQSAPSKGASLKEQVLTGLVKAQCFRTGEFTLKSGEKSPFYIDLRLIMSHPELLKQAARAYASILKLPELAGHEFHRIAGIPAAGLPLAAAVSLETGIPMIFPRTNAKEHGTKRLIEGEYNEGERVLLLDDLITTGTSKIEALEILRSGGLVVEHLVVLLERGAQGRRDMDAAGVNLQAFAHVSEFFPLLEQQGVLTSQERQTMEAYALK